LKRILISALISASAFLVPNHLAHAGIDEWTLSVETSEIVSSFAFDPTNPSTLYAGSRWVYKTTDGGNNWEIINNGMTTPFVNALVIDYNNPNTIYAATGGGVFKTTNGGGIWNAVNNGLNNPWVRALAMDPVNPNILYAGTGLGGGVYKTTNGGSNWEGTSNPTGPFSITSLIINPGDRTRLYAGTEVDGVFRTRNSGENWIPINDGFTDVAGTPFWSTVSSLTIDPRDPAIVYCGMADFLFKTTTGGDSWFPVNHNLNGLFVRAMAIDPGSHNTLYVATGYGGVFKSTDGAGTWTALNNGLDDGDAWSIAIDPGDRNTLYVGVGQAFGAVHKYTQTGTVPGVLQINAGLNGSWYDPGTDGQGFFIDVFPTSSVMFAAWFTYDTEHPDASVTANLGDPSQRWITAQGAFADNLAVLDVYVSGGGLFDTYPPVPTREKDGTLTIEFSDCNTGTVTYDIPSIGRQDVIPIERIVLDNVPLCNSLDGLP
jgi:photosystem II stability/assembly factor-like uncharacterized protein